MATVSIGQCVAAEQPLQRLAQQRFKAKTAFAIHSIAVALEKHLKYYHGQHQKYFKEWGTEPNEKGESQIKDEHTEEFKACMAELIAVEVEVAAEPLELEALGDTELSAMEIMLLGPFLKN